MPPLRPITTAHTHRRRKAPRSPRPHPMWHRRPRAALRPPHTTHTHAHAPPLHNHLHEAAAAAPCLYQAHTMRAADLRRTTCGIPINAQIRYMGMRGAAASSTTSARAPRLREASHARGRDVTGAQHDTSRGWNSLHFAMGLRALPIRKRGCHVQPRATNTLLRSATRYAGSACDIVWERLSWRGRHGPMARTSTRAVREAPRSSPCNATRSYEATSDVALGDGGSLVCVSTRGACGWVGAQPRAMRGNGGCNPHTPSRAVDHTGRCMGRWWREGGVVVEVGGWRAARRWQNGVRQHDAGWATRCRVGERERDSARDGGTGCGMAWWRQNVAWC